MLNALLAEKTTNPAEFNNSPLRLAAEFGHEKIVEILLYDRRVDPSALDNQVNYLPLLLHDLLTLLITSRHYVLHAKMAIMALLKSCSLIAESISLRRTMNRFIGSVKGVMSTA